MIEAIEVFVTVQPKAKNQRLAENIPLSNVYWRSRQQTQKTCWVCGVTPSRTGEICIYCQRQFPIKS